MAEGGPEGPGSDCQKLCRLSEVVHQKDNDCDLTNDIYSQVYGGKTSEKWRTNLAVNSTRGKVLVFEGKAFPSYYHADLQWAY